MAQHVVSTRRRHCDSNVVVLVDLICILSSSSYGHMLSMILMHNFVSLDCAGTGYGPLVVSSLC